MLTRRRLPLLAASVVVLVLATAAAAAHNTFTAALTPGVVKPATAARYTLTVSNGSGSDQVESAKVAIPAGFTNVGEVTANATAAGQCAESTWEADGTLIQDGKINLKRPGGGGNRNLCPGATLTIVFTASSPAEDGSYAWTPELVADDDEDAHAFTLTGDPTVRVDGTPPTVVIEQTPSNPSKSRSATFAFSASDPTDCKLDGGSFEACTSPKAYDGLVDGPHTFTVRATDAVGNTSEATHAWTIDATPPETTITGPRPASPTNTTTASFSFSSSEPGSTFECSLDAVSEGAFAPCTSPTQYSGLPSGTRTFRVQATDALGNVDPSPASHTWTIVLVGPAATILTAPPSSTNSTSASFTLAASDPNATFQCRLDTALFSACPSAVAYTNLLDGQHRFTVRAVPPGQDSTPGPEVSHTWTIDTRPPVATVTAGPPGLTNSRSATFAFTANEPSSFQCQLDAGGLVPCNSPVSYPGTRDGAHTFIVRPTDSVGNAGAAASYSWTVDATAPETTLVARPRPVTTTASATFRFSASESARFECKLDAGAFMPCSSPKTYSRLRRASHRFDVRAIDPAGNIDPTPAIHRWTIGTVRRAAKATSALLAPRAGGRVTSPPLLRWRPVARASYYNVQLYRGRVKVLSVWPTRTRLQLRARWTYLGRQRRLSAGRYRWYVWPGFGRPAARRYGRMLGQSTFTVAARR